jgi:ABC-type sugar transport system permease subunit
MNPGESPWWRPCPVAALGVMQAVVIVLVCREEPAARPGMVLAHEYLGVVGHGHGGGGPVFPAPIARAATANTIGLTILAAHLTVVALLAARAISRRRSRGESLTDALLFGGGTALAAIVPALAIAALAAVNSGLPGFAWVDLLEVFRYCLALGLAVALIAWLCSSWTARPELEE